MLFLGKENVFRLFGCLGIRFTENQLWCLVRSNILWKIKICNQNRKNKRRENLINHSTASNGKVRVIQFNPIPYSYFRTNQIEPQKKQNPEKKIHQIQSMSKHWERGDWVRSKGEIVWRRQRRDRAAEARLSGVGVDLSLIDAVWLARCYDRRDRWSVGCQTRARSEECAAVRELRPCWVRSGNGLKWKYEQKWFYGCFGLFYGQRGKAFQLTEFTGSTKHSSFMEKHFRK